VQLDTGELRQVAEGRVGSQRGLGKNGACVSNGRRRTISKESTSTLVKSIQHFAEIASISAMEDSTAIPESKLSHRCSDVQRTLVGWGSRAVA